MANEQGLTAEVPPSVMKLILQVCENHTQATVALMNFRVATQNHDVIAVMLHWKTLYASMLRQGELMLQLAKLVDAPVNVEIVMPEGPHAGLAGQKKPVRQG